MAVTQAQLDSLAVRLEASFQREVDRVSDDVKDLRQTVLNQNSRIYKGEQLIGGLRTDVDVLRATRTPVERLAPVAAATATMFSGLSVKERAAWLSAGLLVLSGVFSAAQGIGTGAKVLLDALVKVVAQP